MVNKRVELIRDIKKLNPNFKSNKNDSYNDLLKKYRQNLPKRAFINDINFKDRNKFSVSKTERKIQVNGKNPDIITIKNKFKKPLTPTEIKDLAYRHQNLFMLKHKKKPRMLIRGINKIGFSTIKGIQDNINNMFDDEEDYWEDLASDTKKNLQYYQIQITLY